MTNLSLADLIALKSYAKEQCGACAVGILEPVNPQAEKDDATWLKYWQRLLAGPLDREIEEKALDAFDMLTT